MAMFLWVVCEIAIAACDLAEVLGSAVALKLLFGLPLLAGVLITALDVLMVLALQGRGFRLIEMFVVTLIASIAACFAYEIFVAQPLWRQAAMGLVPHLEILRNREMLYIAIGILGATVMPHNLYLHSSIVQTRAFRRPRPRIASRRCGMRCSIRRLRWGWRCFVNAAILVLGAAAFHTRGLHDVAEIADAYKLLSPLLGAESGEHGVCLRVAGFRAELDADRNAGGANCDGRISGDSAEAVAAPADYASIAIVPAALVIGIAGESKVTALLIFSQVVLSFQLPFAVIPLIQFTNSRKKMGEFVNSRAHGGGGVGGGRGDFAV